MPLPSLLLLTSLLIHILAAFTWLSGVALNVIVLTLPGLDTMQRLRLMKRAIPFAWTALFILIPTGIFQTINNPVTPEPVYTWQTLEQLRATPYGTALLIKHIFVITTATIAVIINFILMPRLNAILIGADNLALATPTGAVESPGAEQISRLETRLRRLAIANLGFTGLLMVCVGYIVYTLH